MVLDVVTSAILFCIGVPVNKSLFLQLNPSSIFHLTLKYTVNHVTQKSIVFISHSHKIILQTWQHLNWFKN